MRAIALAIVLSAYVIDQTLCIGHDIKCARMPDVAVWTLVAAFLVCLIGGW